MSPETPIPLSVIPSILSGVAVLLLGVVLKSNSDMKAELASLKTRIKDLGDDVGWIKTKVFNGDSNP